MNIDEMKRSEMYALQIKLDDYLVDSTHELMEAGALLGDAVEGYSLSTDGKSIDFHTSEFYCGETDHFYFEIPFDIVDKPLAEIVAWAKAERERQAAIEKAAKEAMKAEAKAQADAAREAFERAEYARLRKMFGNG